MNYVRPRARLAGCVVAATLFLLASCTSGSADGNAPEGHPSPSASGVSAATEVSEKKPVQQAQAALAAVSSGRMVEAGAERVTDGVHTEPSLSQGRTYRLSLVCVGSGSARLTFAPASTGAGAVVPCDRSVVQQRITVHPPVRVDVDGTKGSTGVIAWRIDAL
ncbi:hypothetical protein [Streptomyces sp. NPDC002265]|uniref:hypothetical protein n=1 Tax=Streptomyces sp. NPDC002265 TaxID=3154415 RepID=UPI00331EE667